MYHKSIYKQKADSSGVLHTGRSALLPVIIAALLVLGSCQDSGAGDDLPQNTSSAPKQTTKATTTVHVFERSYTDEEVVETVLDKFKDQMRSKYGGGASSLYHSASVDESYVLYDELTNTYLCILEASYSTNVFDIFGTSKTSYTVNASLIDTGTKLLITEYSAN